MAERVVITGLGIIAPNAHGLQDYEHALREGRSGIRFIPQLRELKFGCHVAGVPQDVETLAQTYFSAEQRLGMNSDMTFASIAGMDCYRDAGFEVPHPDGDAVDWDTGAVIGTGIGGLDTIGSTLVPQTDAGRVRRLGSTMVEQIMSSCVSAKVGGLLALGGQVTTNSSACTTGTEAVVNAYHAIKSGLGKRMLAGGSEGASHYIWAGFDAMRVLSRTFNDTPEEASRPMSVRAAGFVPGSGAGILMLESLTSAQARGARIYAEVLAGVVNCGGQRQGGSMTAPNPHGVQRCIRGALHASGVAADEIDTINGHLTATIADAQEVNNWAQGLGLSPERFPLINATKSLIGHGLGAAGGMELVAATLQLHKGFVHGSKNCNDLHPSIEPFADSIPFDTVEAPIRTLIKASFGFGDVNGCVILRRWD